jgi:EAL domain-containing protein (putative c-di-GMP-specific phosphodiesterase class I)
VVLEITERALATRPAELLRTVERVRSVGWGVAVDDVGAEAMSLAFMPLLRPDVVKLDLRLVQERPGPAIAEIMNAVNAHAERTGSVVLAEGIEDEAHLAMARALGATLGQGWLFGRPGPGPVEGAVPGSLVLPSQLPDTVS